MRRVELRKEDIDHWKYGCSSGLEKSEKMSWVRGHVDAS